MLSRAARPSAWRYPQWTYRRHVYIAYLDGEQYQRTSWSIRAPCFRTQPCQSCTGGQCPAQEGRRGWGLEASATRGTHTRQHRADGQKDYRQRTCLRTLRDRQGRAPLVPQNVQADAAIRVDIRVVDLRRERHLGRLEGVVRRECNGQEEHTATVRRVTLPRK